ncbi:MAG: pyridoxal-phosphate dependent enzyme [Chitinophagales bacterium]|nr:pyridoxal-phosphate dependent enzyme [Chitinophagales bacterium]
MMFPTQHVNDLLSTLQLPSPLQTVSFSLWKDKDLEIYFKRDDLIHPLISGNKWRKLYGHLLKFYQDGHQGILTFGGAYSNHIIATAATCNLLNISSIGIIRGEISDDNPAMKIARENKMHLISLSRSLYKSKNLSTLKLQNKEIDWNSYMIVPEGGGAENGVVGCKEIIDELDTACNKYDYIITACGTGTTCAGLAKYSNAEIVGVSVLKGEDTLSDKVYQLCKKDNFKIFTNYHHGGYTRKTTQLMTFAKSFTEETQIPLDYVYTSKMVYAFNDLVQKNFFPKGSKIVLLHTGGLVNAPIV